MRTLPSWRGIAGISAIAIAIATLPGIALTNASWVDEEYDYGQVSSLLCTGNTDLQSRASGRFLTGAVGGTSLDALAGVTGVVVANNGNTAAATAGTPGATPLGTAPYTAYNAPISATAINNAIGVGTAVNLPIPFPVGVYDQYGRALDTGVSTGASGAVLSSGAVDVNAASSPSAPTVGHLTLSGLPFVGAPLSGLTDLSLDIGAVAAAATLDGCSLAWTGGAPTTDQLKRTYLVSQLRANLSSAALRALFGTTGTVPAATGVVQGQINTLFGTAAATDGTAETGIASAALTGLLGAVGSAVSGINILGVGLQVGTGRTGSSTVTMNLQPVIDLLTQTKTTGGVSVNLGTGVVTVDLATLAGSLDNRDPNTPVLTSAQLNTVLGRVDTIVADQIALVNTELRKALDAATVTVAVHVNVSTTLTPGLDVIGVDLGFNGTLAEIAAGTLHVTGPSIGLIGTPIGLGGLVSALTSNLTPLIGGITSTVLSSIQTLAYNPINPNVTAFLAAASAQRTTSITALSGVFTALAQVVSLTLNSQPDVLPFPAKPSASPQTGEYFVSALRIGVLDRTGAGANSLLNLYLATASVGPNVE